MKKRSPGGCSSFLLMLLLVFVILKLTGAVAWSWWWVTSPLWMPIAFLLAGVALAAVLGVGVFKIVSMVLGRQHFGRIGDRVNGRRESRGETDQVVEAEGSEVTSKPAGAAQRALPQTTYRADSDDSTR